MKSPSPHPFEDRRLAALRRLQILDTAPETEFDEVARVAADVCRTPIALISLVDERRQWFKAKVGLAAPETSREVAFCAHAILRDAIFEVPDAQVDARFADNPLVTGSPHVRFYAGAPLMTEDGDALGTLCVIDSQPRTLSAVQRSALQILAHQVVARLAAREPVSQVVRVHDTDATPGPAPRCADALTRALHRICQSAGWPLGFAHAEDRFGNQVCDDVAFAAGPAFDAFVHARSKGVPSPHALLQRVYASARAEWLDLDDGSYPLAPAARALGLRMALAFPIFSYSQVVGTFECLTFDNQPPDTQLIEVISQVGVDVGRVVDRIQRGPGGADHEPPDAALNEARAQALALAEEVERRTSFTQLTSQFGAALDRCRHVREIESTFGEFAGRLFPDASGALACVSEDERMVETVSAWGGQTGASLLFDVDECVALRRRQLHESPPESSGRCKHVSGGGVGHLCAPVVAQDRALAVLTVAPNAGNLQALRRPAACVAELLGLAFANHRLRELVRDQATRDPLTGLCSLRHLIERFDRVLIGGPKASRVPSMCLIDVDQLGRQNDRSGYEKTDSLLREIADYLLASSHKEDIVCRVTGGRFAIALVDETAASGLARAETIRRGIKTVTADVDDEIVGPVSASLGLSRWPDHGRDAAALFAAAEAALMGAKATGRDCVVLSGGQGA